MTWDHDDLLDHLWDDHSGMDELGYGDPIEVLVQVHEDAHAGVRIGLPPRHTHPEPTDG